MRKQKSDIAIKVLLFAFCGIFISSCGGSGRRAATYVGVKLLDEAEEVVEDYLDDDEYDDEYSGGSNVSFGKKGSQADYGTSYRWYYDTSASCPYKNSTFSVYKPNGLSIVSNDQCNNCGYTYSVHN